MNPYINPATLIFLLTYILVALGENSPRKLDRSTATLMGTVLMVATGALSRAEAAAAIDLSTLAVLFGLMLLLTILLQSGFPTWLAFKAMARCRSPQSLLALVVFTSGFASALMLNDTVCLLGTPLLLEMTATAGLPAAPYLLALATSANIGWQCSQHHRGPGSSKALSVKIPRLPVGWHPHHHRDHGPGSVDVMGFFEVGLAVSQAGGAFNLASS